MHLPLTLAILLTAASLSAQTGNLSIKSGVIDFGSATSTQVVKVVANIAALPGTCTDGAIAYVTAEAAGSQLYTCKSNAWTLAGGTTTPQTHSYTCTIGATSSTTVISTGDTGCYADNGALTGTINRVDTIGFAAALATCSITVDIWKRSAAVPASGNKISASAPATLTTANIATSGSLSGWTTSVASNDQWGSTVATVTGCVYAQVKVFFQ